MLTKHECKYFYENTVENVCIDLYADKANWFVEYVLEVGND